MSRLRGRRERRGTCFSATSGLILCLWNLPLLIGCDRAPREPVEARPVERAPDAQESASPTRAAAQPEGKALSPDPLAKAAGAEPCVVPLVAPPPPQVASVDECPADPTGRPQMPQGSVTFLGAKNAPELKVELALSALHQRHGLMYRPTLDDEEGMLFSWNTEIQRFFWMKNTCLALDMLFIARDGTIAGILENVPPWNERPQRTIPCPAAHVLEVRAGWTRAYGVIPGQKVTISTAP